MKKMQICAFVMMIIMLGGCTTQVRFVTEEPGAFVYVDGALIGKTPVSTEMSNAVWNEPEINIKKEGYNPIYTTVKKEVKAVNAVCGFLFFWPSLLWCYGPKPIQRHHLYKQR